ncbi:hypothetical protein ABBQ38_012963 [Trebouxia sp. C0009 RCD-2024]
MALEDLVTDEQLLKMTDQASERLAQCQEARDERDRLESYKYLGFILHVTKAMTSGTTFLVAAARKAMFAMQRRCALPSIEDPAMQAI